MLLFISLVFYHVHVFAEYVFCDKFSFVFINVHTEQKAAALVYFFQSVIPHVRFFSSLFPFGFFYCLCGVYFLC